MKEFWSLSAMAISPALSPRTSMIVIVFKLNPIETRQNLTKCMTSIGYIFKYRNRRNNIVYVLVSTSGQWLKIIEREGCVVGSIISTLSRVIIIGLCRCTEYVSQADAMQSEALIGQSAPASHRMIVWSAARWLNALSFDNGASGSR